MQPNTRERLRTIAWSVGIAMVVLVVGAASCFDLPSLWRLSKLANESNSNAQSRGASAVGDTRELRILAYSSFTSSWGPGPTLVKLFEDKMNAAGEGSVEVMLLQAEDSGLLLAKMDAFPTDIVIGFDQLGRQLATKTKIWRPHAVEGSRFSTPNFLAFDWSPIGFVYREGEIDPPKNFEDLLDARFDSTIALQDPRSSSPGFQFLNWLVAEMGEAKAFEYLAKLKPNVHSMSGSWSQSYGMFTRGLAKITFSYATSILYHRLSEKDDRYRFATFPNAHPVQVEFAAIPDSCQNCELAETFMKFLVSQEAQAVLMNKNWMMPVNPDAAKGTPFELLMTDLETKHGLKVQDTSLRNGGDSSGMLKRWREVGL